MPIDYQKLTEASLRLKITDLERARRYELEQLKQAVTLLDEVLDKPLDQNSLHKRISIFLDGTIHPVAHDAQPTNGAPTMTPILHDLILTPILRLQIGQGTTEAGKPSLDLIAELRLDSGWSTLKCEAEERGLTLTDLDRLAEQFHLASLQIRGIIEELNPGRRFELSQIEQFGIDRLEDGSVADD